MPPTPGAAMLKRVPMFLIEAYLPDAPGALSDASARARGAADLGEGVQHLRTTFISSDELCLHFFVAPSAAVLDDAARHADLVHLRIVETVESTERRSGEAAV